MENTINDAVDQNQSQILTQSEAIAPPLPPPPKSKFKKGGLLLGITILLIVVGLTGYYYWTRLNHMDNVPYGMEDWPFAEKDVATGETRTYFSSINEMSFEYPKCLGEATICEGCDPTIFGESVKFSQPNGCSQEVDFGTVHLGIGGIDRDGGGGAIQRLISQERFTNSQGKEYVLMVFEIEAIEADEADDKKSYYVTGFYPQESGGDEKSTWVFYMNSYHDDKERVTPVKDFYKSILETVKFESVAVEDFGGEYKKCPPKQSCSVVSLTQKTGSSFEVKGQAYYGTNTGLIDGMIEITDGKAVYSEDDCVIDLTMLSKYEIKLEERETGSCGGLNVTFNGTYAKGKW